MNESPKVVWFVDESVTMQQKVQTMCATLLTWRFPGPIGEGKWGECEEMGAEEMAQ